MADLGQNFEVCLEASAGALIVWYHDHANKKVAAFPEQRLKLSKSTVFLVPKTMGIGGFFKNFGKCPKMAHFGQNLA